MFQWVEHQTETQEYGENVIKYSYTQGWFPYKIDSRGFKNQGYQNP